MKVKHLIEMLQKEYSPEDSLIVATWEKKSFDSLLEEDDDWADIAQSCMDEVDWTGPTEDIIEHIEMLQTNTHYGDSVFEGVPTD
jgi:hypothetical protein